MVMPIGILYVILLGAAILSAYALFGKDGTNYTEVLSGFIASILWFVSCYGMLIGIRSDGIDWMSSWLAWIFAGIGVIMALVFFVNLIDTVSAKDEGEKHVGDMDVNKMTSPSSNQKKLMR
jgi:hypothetical protein